MVPVPSQFVAYCTLTVSITEPIEEHVSPVVRPDLATAKPTDGACPCPALGAPGTGTPFASTAFPNFRMFPEKSTEPETTWAIAACTVPVLLLKVPCDRLATVLVSCAQ